MVGSVAAPVKGGRRVVAHWPVSGRPAVRETACAAVLEVGAPCRTYG
jgi:hypothetical protein